jgi:hypothetical protein
VQYIDLSCVSEEIAVTLLVIRFFPDMQGEPIGCARCVFPTAVSRLNKQKFFGDCSKVNSSIQLPYIGHAPPAQPPPMGGHEGPAELSPFLIEFKTPPVERIFLTFSFPHSGQVVIAGADMEWLSSKLC